MTTSPTGIEERLDALTNAVTALRAEVGLQRAASAKADLLMGAKAIAEFLTMTEKQARHRIEAGIIPVFRMPGDTIICARRSSLNAWLAEQEAKARSATNGG